MDYNYYVHQKKAYVNKKTLADKYELKLSVLSYMLMGQDLPTINIDREVFYQVGQVSKYLNDKTGLSLNWKQ